MKKLASLIGMLVVLAAMVYAPGNDLTPKDITMAQDDSVLVDYCVDDITCNEATCIVDVTVDPICEDANGISGCQAADSDIPDNTGEFWAEPVSPGYIETNEDGEGCLDIELTTSEDANGLFYYKVNGAQESSVVVSETGSVFVPEFTVIGAGAALAIAGMYIAKKRKN